MASIGNLTAHIQRQSLLDLRHTHITRRQWIRFMRKVMVSPEGHWLWQGPKNARDYGIFYWHKQRCYAHRFAYIALRGDIPSALQIDHLCRIHNCVNPACLEVVTGQTNSLRGESPTAHNARKEQCIHGHLFTEDNTSYKKEYYQHGAYYRLVRLCKTCNAERSRRNRASHPAYGRSRVLTPGQRARYVAESIALKEAEGQPWSFADYGLEANDAMQALVTVALGTLYDAEDRRAVEEDEQARRMLEAQPAPEREQADIERRILERRWQQADEATQ